MTLSDWMAATPSDLMEQAMPGYGDLLRTLPTQWWSRMYAPYLGQIGGPATQPQPGYQLYGRVRHHRDCDCGCHDDERHEGHHGHHRQHGCSHCGHEPCECLCCIGDVDLAVYTRVGEQRVVPIVVENERRREKEIKLELSGWTTRGGNEAPVETVFIEPTELTLAPCSEQEVTLVVRVRPKQQQQTGDAPKDDVAVSERAHLTDVDSCDVATADLRLVGCDHRAIRIAVAILPRDCDPFRVGCGCTCC